MTSPWATVGGVGFQWLERSPNGRTAQCDSCHRIVAAHSPRLRLADGQGPVRVRSKGHRHSYLCEGCGNARLSELNTSPPDECGRCHEPVDVVVRHGPINDGRGWWCLPCMEVTAKGGTVS